MKTDTVYLVEVNRQHPMFIGEETARKRFAVDEAAGGCSYLMSVYESEPRAKKAVEFWANRGGAGPSRWQDGRYVLIAYAEGSPEWIYKVVPLGVLGDTDPEVPPGT